MSSEDQLINRVTRKVPFLDSRLRTGIGDDAAVIKSAPPGQIDLVVTTDAFLENVHFLRRIHPAKAVGYKALARATSDLAAMGAKPRFFLLTIGLPAICIGRWLDEFLVGMARAARRFGLILAGGDTTRYPDIVASLTVIGEVASGTAVLRSGARPGDLICVSGRLGEAELGLRLIQKGLHRKAGWRDLVKKHAYPEPRLALGQWLGQRNRATAMIDTSDGFSTDLGRLCKASGVGARVWADKIPIVRTPAKLAASLRLNPFEMALNGGEDYELVFTMGKSTARRLSRVVANVPITIVGEITRGKDLTLVHADGRERPLRPEGWDPFLKPKSTR